VIEVKHVAVTDQFGMIFSPSRGQYKWPDRWGNVGAWWPILFSNHSWLCDVRM